MTRTRSTLGAGPVVAAALALVGLAGAARAQDPVDLKVVDRDSGQVLPVWRDHGRLYVAGRPGARYGLRVTNHTDGRVLVVMSVDGVNILTGETAGWDQRGYIFDPDESGDINGWRKSTQEVADFTFTPQSRSYAARTGRPLDVGVIGIAVFDEKVWAPPPEPYASASPRRGGGGDNRDAQRSPNLPAAPPKLALARPSPPPPPPPPPPSSAAGSTVTELSATAQKREQQLQNVPVAITAFTGAQRDAAGIRVGQARRAAPADETEDRAALDEKLGTGHGAREWSVVNVEPFERATARPRFTEQIEYDTYAHLVAAGVIHPYAEGRRHPQPFPTSPQSGYVPDPPDDP